MNALAATIITFAVCLGASAAPASATNPFEIQRPAGRANRIDELVFNRLEKLDIEPAHLCADGVFLRRAYLDVIGTLPSAFESRKFILDRDPRKRETLIDYLLQREEFTDYWAMKWSDLLRVKAEFPINLWPNAAQAYHRWIRTAIKQNKSYDQFARELLTASGSNFREPPVNFYRAMQNREPAGIAQTVALTFMGTRAEKWPTNQFAGLVAFFSQVGYKSTAEWKEEILFFDPGKATNQLWLAAEFPDGKPARLSGESDPRQVFADWLIAPGNPWFTRNIANRVWSWVMGRGIIQEPDDIRPDNAPSNPELLAFLESELISAHYDLKHLMRLILNSRTYQLSSIARSDRPEAAANFAAYPVRRLDAEVLVDALDQITASTEKYSSAIPEPFTFFPEERRSISLPDGSLTSPFLEMFGRPSRDTGLESERNNGPSASQRLHCLNSSHILRKIGESRMIEYQAGPKKTPQEIGTGMYLAVLSRFPNAEELKIIEDHFEKAGPSKRREAAVDFAWALINTAEFLYRH